MATLLTEVLVNRAASSKMDLNRTKYLLKVLQGKELLEVAVRLQNLPSWEKDVENVYIWASGKHSTVDIEIALNKETAAGSTLPREIVLHKLAHKLDKSKSWDGGSIRVRGTLFPERKWKGIKGVTIAISGYVPQTCQVVWEEVVVPAHTERKAKIVCAPETDAEAQAAMDNDTILAPITADTETVSQ